MDVAPRIEVLARVTIRWDPIELNIPVGDPENMLADPNDVPIPPPWAYPKNNTPAANMIALFVMRST